MSLQLRAQLAKPQGMTYQELEPAPQRLAARGQVQNCCRAHHEQADHEGERPAARGVQEPLLDALWKQVLSDVNLYLRGRVVSTSRPVILATC